LDARSNGCGSKSKIRSRSWKYLLHPANRRQPPSSFATRLPYPSLCSFLYLLMARNICGGSRSGYLRPATYNKLFPSSRRRSTSSKSEGDIEGGAFLFLPCACSPLRILLSLLKTPYTVLEYRPGYFNSLMSDQVVLSFRKRSLSSKSASDNCSVGVRCFFVVMMPLCFVRTSESCVCNVREVLCTYGRPSHTLFLQSFNLRKLSS
jgi:hypothetical protein